MYAMYATPMYTTLMYATLMYAMYATPIELIVGDTAKLLDEKGALAGNITRTELRAAMEDCIRQAVEMYERRIGRPIPVEDFEADIMKSQFYRWRNNSFHRLPEDFILTCIGTSENGNVAKTPLQDYLHGRLQQRNIPDPNV